MIDKEEDSGESEMSNLDKELWEISNEMFDKEIWNSQTKEEMKDLSKKDLAKTMFGLGFITHQKVMDEEIKDMEKIMLKDPELSKSIEGFKEKLNKLGESDGDL